MRSTRKRRPEEKAAEPGGAAPRIPADDILTLQQGAGNQAVARMLARDAAAPEAGGVEADAESKSDATMDVGDKDIGPLELLAFSTAEGRAPKNGDLRGEDPPTEFTVMLKPGKSSPKLLQAVADGRRFETIVITLQNKGKASLVYRLKEAMFTSHSTGGRGGDPDKVTDDLGISAGSVEIEYQDARDAAP